MPYDDDGNKYEMDTNYRIYSHNDIEYCVEEDSKSLIITNLIVNFSNILQEKFTIKFNKNFYIRFVNLKSVKFGGFYNKFNRTIIINTFDDITYIKMIHNLFHEYGHYIYNEEIINRNEWLRYYINNLRKISRNKLIISRDKLNIYDAKYRKNILKTSLLCSEYNSKRTEIFIKSETYYQLNEEEIFCETFATYMVGKCLYKSNEKIMRELLQC